MKIAVWVLSDYKQQMGGGFALYDKFIQMIDAYKFSDELDVCFVGYNPVSNYKFSKKYIQLNYFGSASMNNNGKQSVLDSFLNKKLSRYSHRIPLLNKRERKVLDANDVDLLFYPVQGFRKIPDFPFVVSNWDIGHKASYALPELGMNYSFDYREKWYSKNIFKALMVFAESESGREELLYYTKLNPQRVKIVPLFPGGVVNVKADGVVQQEKIEKLSLQKGRYFFYPAQFWAHKNHYNLLLAFKKLNDEFPDLKMVFTGSDKGNKNYIREVVAGLGLEKNVLFPGFVDNETMVGIYSNAAAMIMPSFLGPTNMPLLEARELGCPVLCSNLPGHMEMMGEGALYFDPADHLQMLDRMKKILDPETRSELLRKAGEKLSSSFFTSENALKQLELHFKNLIPVRKSWGKSNKIF